MNEGISLIRVVLFFVAVFIASRLVIEVMYLVALPLEWRLLVFVVALPCLGWRVGPYLFVRR